MGSDMLVALGKATVDGHTLFGQNSSRPAGECPALRLAPGRPYTPGEKLHTQYLELAQARQTCTVLGSQPRDFWGYDHGVNEYQVAAGCVPLRPTLACATPGLLGTDLVRLALERGRSARQAVDALTALIERHGQCSFPDGARVPHDNAFLIADGREAYAVEAAGAYWVYQEIREVRAVSNVRIIRQDWDRIASGLAAQAIDRGWWPGDGSKLDFAGALAEDLNARAPALRRWGRATLALQEQNGHIDAPFLRRLLADHDEEGLHEAGVEEHAADSASLCRHATCAGGSATAASLLCPLTTDPARLPMAWCALGAPCASVYFPAFLDGELPEPFTNDGPEAAGLWRSLNRLGEELRHDPGRRTAVRDSFARLQATFEQEADEFLAEGMLLKQRGDTDDLHRQAGLFMQHTLERFEEALADLLHLPTLAAMGG